MARKFRDFTHKDLIRFYEENLSAKEQELLLRYIDPKRIEQFKTWQEEMNDFMVSLIPGLWADALNEILKTALDWLWNKIEGPLENLPEELPEPGSSLNLDYEGFRVACAEPVRQFYEEIKKA